MFGAARGRTPRRASHFLEPGLDQQGEQQQRGLQGQHLCGTERTKGVQKHGGLVASMLAAGRGAGGLTSGGGVHWGL